MRTRGSADGEIPPVLLDWRLAEGMSKNDWHRARRAWAREHCRTIDELNALYGKGVVFPPEEDPRVGGPDWDLTVALNPTLNAHRRSMRRQQEEGTNGEH